MAVRPSSPEFGKVESNRCGRVCTSEERLLPRRHCGGKDTFAIYRVDSAAEVREQIESGASDEGGKIGQDVWPSWPQRRRGAASEKKEARNVAKQIIKGISYGPVPLRKHGRLPDDDFMSETTEALWGNGRRDLAIIRALGATTVRLYGNDPALDHTEFLDEAMAQGLEVILGISDYPYTQMPDNCFSTNFNCYQQVRDQYIENLKRGLLSVGNVYHPTLQTIILMNEPDLKFPGGPRSYCKALVSAFDAVLDAEKAMGVAGEAPAFTATFSFGVCPRCSDMGWKPALGQMIELRKAMMHPESVGYTTKNDIWAAYQARFINSVNTANPATDIRRLFLDNYDELFPRVPVFIGEYHSPRMLDQKRDLQTILDIAANESTMLQGISFFEYQVRYDKGGSEMSFGMFGLSDRTITDMRIGYGAFSVYCLTPLEVAVVAGRSYRNDCGPIEVGVDYISDSAWSMSMDHVASPELCCKECAKNVRCRSWTWVEDAGLASPGMPSQCWLKGGRPTGKVPKDGVISGIPKAFVMDSEAGRDLVKQENEATNSAVLGPSSSAAPRTHHRQLRFGQCGGKFWRGPTMCPEEFSCARRNEFYSQCLPISGTGEVFASLGIEDTVVPNIFVHMAVASAFGGPGVSSQDLCPVETTVTTTKEPDHIKTDSVGWYGCYMQGPQSSYVYSNEQGGYTSASCSRACRGYTFALLHNFGHCSCASSKPSDSHFAKVDDLLCGQACTGEEDLKPTRFCGEPSTFAIYNFSGNDQDSDSGFAKTAVENAAGSGEKSSKR